MKVKSEHISIIFITAATMTVLFALLLYINRKERHKQPHNAPALYDVTLKGTVEKYGSNPDRDIDKLLLKSDDEERWLHFPPNTAKAVLSVAQPGDVAEIIANDRKKGPAPAGVEQMELISLTNTTTGKTFMVQHIPPPPPAEGKEVDINGIILSYIADDKGHTRSVVIDNWLISLPPHARDALLPLLVKNKKITIKGWERGAASGFVNEDSLTVVRPFAAIIDGTQYSIQ